MVEPLPSKQAVAGSNPVSRSKFPLFVTANPTRPSIMTVFFLVRPLIRHPAFSRLRMSSLDA